MTARLVHKKYWWGSEVQFNNNIVLSINRWRAELLLFIVNIVIFILMIISMTKIAHVNSQSYPATITETYNLTDIMRIDGYVPLRCNQIQCCALRVDRRSCYAEKCIAEVLADKIYTDNRRRPRCRQLPVEETNKTFVALTIVALILMAINFIVLYLISSMPEIVADVLGGQDLCSDNELCGDIARFSTLQRNICTLYVVRYTPIEIEGNVSIVTEEGRP